MEYCISVDTDAQQKDKKKWWWFEADPTQLWDETSLLTRPWVMGGESWRSLIPNEARVLKQRFWIPGPADTPTSPEIGSKILPSLLNTGCPGHLKRFGVTSTPNLSLENQKRSWWRTPGTCLQCWWGAQRCGPSCFRDQTTGPALQGEEKQYTLQP